MIGVTGQDGAYIAEACIFVMCLPKSRYASVTKPMQSHINAGTGTDLTFRELAEMIKEIVGFEGSLRFNTERPGGTPRKMLEVLKLEDLGWTAKTSLRDGIEQTYRWYREQGRGAS